MVDIFSLTHEDFKELPLVIEGESKEVRYAGEGKVVIYFKPTIYSFTSNRCEVVPMSNIPRLLSSMVFNEALEQAGVKHAYLQMSHRYVLALLVMPSDVEFKKYDLPVFVPPDLTADEIAKLPKAPPIEVVIKRYLTGTTKHGCIGMAGSRVRSSHPFYANMPLDGDGALPEMLVRFDWRNPLKNQKNGLAMANTLFEGLIEGGLSGGRISLKWKKRMSQGYKGYYDLWNKAVAFGERVADVAMPPQLADLFIDVEKARNTAVMAARAIEEALAKKNIVFYDMCMFIDESGEMVYGELSPDCGRYRHLDLGSLDKDVWRSGGSSSDVLRKWFMLCWLLDPRSEQEGKSLAEIEAAADHMMNAYSKQGA